MCTCTHTHVYMYTHACIHVHTHVYMYTHACIHVNISIYVCTIHKCIYIYSLKTPTRTHSVCPLPSLPLFSLSLSSYTCMPRVSVCTHVYVCMYVCIYIYAHIHTEKERERERETEREGGRKGGRDAYLYININLMLSRCAKALLNSMNDAVCWLWWFFPTCLVRAREVLCVFVFSLCDHCGICVILPWLLVSLSVPIA